VASIFQFRFHAAGRAACLVVVEWIVLHAALYCPLVGKCINVIQDRCIAGSNISGMMIQACVFYIYKESENTGSCSGKGGDELGCFQMPWHLLFSLFKHQATIRTPGI
jgi:hypothetical protein